MKFLSYSAFALFAIVALNACSKDDNGGGGGASVSTLSCVSATFTGIANPSVAYSGTATVAYVGGNGATYAAGTAIASTGVTGLTATLQAGTLQNGAGNIIFSVSGTPSATGTASFPISFGGQSCSINLQVVAAAPYLGKWNYQYIRDSIYNWYEAVYNNNLQYDSIRPPVDLRTSGAYFQFNAGNTYTWLTSGGTTYTGSFVPSTTTYAYGTKLGLLGITTDTLDFYIYTLSGNNMTLNRDFFYDPNNGDTIIIDRYYDLLKQ